MRQILLLTAMFASVMPLSSCRPGTRYTYTGRVYDGLTNAPLTGYTIELRWGTSKIRGSVDAEGVYTLDGVPSLTDFTVKITAADYRAFLSNNSAEAEGSVGTRVENVNVVRIRDAYVWPNAARAPASVINVYLEDSTDRPSGTLRLQPTSISATLAENDQTIFTDVAGGTAVRRWFNSLDTQGPNIIKEFTGGRIAFEEGELPLGVVFSVSFYNVANYRFQNNNNAFTAGFDTNNVFTLVRQKPASDILHWVRTNIDDGSLVPSGEFIITFDSDLELDPAFSQQYYDDLVKRSFSISSLDYDRDGQRNLLVVDDNLTPADETDVRIASVRVEGNRLVFRASASGASMSQVDPDDAITAIQYDLAGFRVRQLGRVDQAFLPLIGLDKVTGNIDLPTPIVRMLAEPPTP